MIYFKFGLVTLISLQNKSNKYEDLHEANCYKILFSKFANCILRCN